MRTALQRVLPLMVVFFATVAIASGGPVALDTGQQSTDGQQTIHTNSNTSNYLSPQTAEITGEEYQSVSIDVASGVNEAATNLEADHEIRTFERDMQVVPDRTEFADKTHEEIRDRYQLLDRQQERLFEQYNDGEIPSRQLFSQLVQLDTAANTQVAYRSVVDDYSNPPEEFRGEINSLEIAANTEKRVTERIRESQRGSSEPTTVYAMSAEESLVLATVSDGSFIRQATVLSERNLGGENQFDNRWGDAFDRAEMLYPWVWNVENRLDFGTTNSLFRTQLYTVTAEHIHGDIRMYFDGATGNVFHENQRKPLAIQEQTNQVFNSTDEHEINVDLYAEAGPMQVTVQDLEDNLIQDANITVNGDDVGQTGTSGQLWLVRPAGSFDVTATTPDGETVSVTIPAGV